MKCPTCGNDGCSTIPAIMEEISISLKINPPDRITPNKKWLLNVLLKIRKLTNGGMNDQA